MQARPQRQNILNTGHAIALHTPIKMLYASNNIIFTTRESDRIFVKYLQFGRNPVRL